MGGTLGGGDPLLVVNLGGGDVAVAEQFLDFADVDSGSEEQGGGRRPQGVRGVGAAIRVGITAGLGAAGCGESLRSRPSKSGRLGKWANRH